MEFVYQFLRLQFVLLLLLLCWDEGSNLWRTVHLCRSPTPRHKITLGMYLLEPFFAFEYPAQVQLQVKRDRTWWQSKWRLNNWSQHGRYNSCFEIPLKNYHTSSAAHGVLKAMGKKDMYRGAGSHNQDENILVTLESSWNHPETSDVIHEP
jgi:hypothetical protein